MTGVSRIQPMGESLPERLRVNSCRYAHETPDAASTRRIQTEFEAADRITELEANEAAYEAIIGPRTYNEVAEHVRTMERTLQWIVNSPGAHPGNMVKVAEDALSHTGPVARDGELK